MRISLRLKLTLITLLLLAIPYTGIRLASIVKDSLLASRKEALMFSARAVASALSGRDGLFDQELFHSLDQNRDLYLYHLNNPMRLNGKTDDWQDHLKNIENFGIEHIISGQESYSPAGSGFSHLVGKRGKYLYALFMVNDDTLVYRQKNALAVHRSDHLRITIEDRQGNLNNYIVTAERPGWVNGFLMTSYGERLVPKRSETRIQGVWQPNSGGYILEMRIPLDLIGNRLAFAIGDVDDAVTRTTSTVIGTANTDESEKIGWLLTQSTNLEKILESLNRPQSRIQIVDSNQHIRASYGSLKAAPQNGNEIINSFSNKFYLLLSPLFHLFTEPFVTDFQEAPDQPSTLDLEGVKEALLGGSSISTYKFADADVAVMAAITPLYEKNTIIGAVVVEQTTNSILALKNRVIEESIILTMMVLLSGGFGLLFFAFRISSRILQLRNDAARSIGSNGQILDVLPVSRAKDEIGDLSRTIHSVLTELKAQGQYREKMADNLEHEMRTPLASASASLKNLAKEIGDQPEHIQSYVNWALRDIKRMEDLLSAIRDATSLKSALDQGFKERFNLSEALGVWLNHSWRQAFSEVEFQTALPDEDTYIIADPDKIRQMLDKLMENAVAFHKKGTAVKLQMVSGRGYHTIQVINRGPLIPEDQLEEIFNSMVSVRQQQDSKPHLGLGLFIVRTIAQHHGGSVTAKNIGGEKQGVCFSVRLPNTSNIPVQK